MDQFNDADEAIGMGCVCVCGVWCVVKVQLRLYSDSSNFVSLNCQVYNIISQIIYVCILLFCIQFSECHHFETISGENILVVFSYFVFISTNFVVNHNFIHCLFLIAFIIRILFPLMCYSYPLFFLSPFFFLFYCH